jgi:hypothetical protein
VRGDSSTQNDLGFDGGYEEDGEDEDGESVPRNVKSQVQFYSHFMKYGLERLKTWSRWVGVAPDRQHYEQTMLEARVAFDELDHFLEQRHSTLTPDGRIPLAPRTSTRHKPVGEHRHRRGPRANAVDPDQGSLVLTSQEQEEKWKG